VLGLPLLGVVASHLAALSCGLDLLPQSLLVGFCAMAQAEPLTFVIVLLSALAQHTPLAQLVVTPQTR
jgi:hypothetical protein